VSEREAKSWAEEQGLEYIETSAKTGENVEEVGRLRPRSKRSPPYKRVLVYLTYQAFNATARLIHAKVEANKLRPKPGRGPGSSPFALVASTTNAARGCCA
jgi:Ras family